MLHMILLILKIIGIALLAVLGLLVLAIVCVLFVPVRYRVRAVRQEGEGQPPAEAYVKVTWLLHLVNFSVRYPAAVIIRARILCFTLFRLPQREKKSDKKRQKSRKRQKAESRAGEDRRPDAELPAEEKTGKSAEMLSETETEHRVEEIAGESGKEAVYEPYQAFDEGTPFGEAAGDEGATEEEGTAASVFGRIGAFFGKCRQAVEKIKGFFQNIRYTIRKICDKIKSVLDHIQYYREVMESEPFQASLGLCRRQLSRVVRMLKPDRFEAEALVDMADPAVTGEILAVYGMLYPLIGRHVRLTGGFACERTKIEGRLYIRGKVRVFTLIRAAVCVYFDRDVRKLIRMLKKEAA